MKQFWCILKLVVDHCFEIDFISWYWQKTSSKLLQNLQGLWQYSWILHLQVTTFFKHWVNTREYYHNTCEYWAGEYTLSLGYSSSVFCSIRIHPFTIRIDFGNSNCIVVCSALKYCLLKNTCEIVFFLFVLPLLVTKLNFVQSNIPFFSVHNISWLWICRMKLLGLLVLNQGTWKWKMPMYLIKLDKTVGNWLEF